MSNTVERISTVTVAHVNAAMQSYVARYEAAARDMVERYFRRATPCAPQDMKSPSLPVMPRLPTDIAGVDAPISIEMWADDTWRTDSSTPTAIHRNGRGLKPISDSVTPANMVRALRALAVWATEAETLAAQYRESVLAASVAHISAQSDAVRELAGLVGATATAEAEESNA